MIYYNEYIYIYNICDQERVRFHNILIKRL